MRSLIVFAILLFMSLSACDGSSTFSIQPNDIGDLAATSITLAVPSLIQDSLRKKPEARKIWQLIHSSLTNQLIPLLSGDKVNLSNLKDWLDVFMKEKVSDCAMDIINPVIGLVNLLLKKIPSEKLKAEAEKTQLSNDLRKTFLTIAEAFQKAIFNVLNGRVNRAIGDC